MSGGCAAAPRWRWRAGRYELTVQATPAGVRWGLSDRARGVSARTPWGAVAALARWRRVPARPVAGP